MANVKLLLESLRMTDVPVVWNFAGNIPVSD